MKKIFFTLFFLLGLMAVTAGRNSNVYAADGDATGTTTVDPGSTGGTAPDPDGTGKPTTGTTGGGGTTTPAKS